MPFVWYNHRMKDDEYNGPLYTYVPDDNTVSTDGIMAPRSMPIQVIGHYRKRVERDTGVRSANRRQILEWMESTFPGRSRGVCVLTKPIPKGTAENLDRFLHGRTGYQLPSFRTLVDAGVIEPEAMDMKSVRKRRWVKALRDKLNYADATKAHTYKTFMGLDHYDLILRGKSIPPDMVHKIKEKK